jgi:tetratricopeptide (TPR) repeat protein
VALEGKKRVEARVNQSVAAALSRGREALKRGSHLEARRQFLLALALDPADKVAFDALQSEIKETRVIQHNVRKGETLASLAEYYYGDRSRSEVIWEVNQLPPNPKIGPGMVLRIPEIPGVQFRPQGPHTPGPIAEAPKAEATEPVGVDANPMLDDARDALERKEFSLALASVDKFLGQNPRSAEALELKKTLLYQQAKGYFEQKKYADSYAALNQLSKLSPNYQDTAALLGRARTQLVQQHYSQGLRFYREEKLQAAIAEWRHVLQFDSNHEAAKKNIDQAQRLLKGLQQRQQKK